MAAQPPREGPSDEELAAYLGQLREAPVTDLIAQAVAMLVNAAQVKLGLPDGRTLIDATAAIMEAAGDGVEDSFRREVEGIVNQLRVAQVEAEQQVAASPGGGAQSPSPGEAPIGGSDAASVPSETEQRGTGSAGSRLWVPPGAS
ncbi:MAG: hypothetical protein KY469_12990 [Actinobacteria bacterium]|nr:hypothetical protein [Actinomycetota bacterium]